MKIKKINPLVVIAIIGVLLIWTAGVTHLGLTAMLYMTGALFVAVPAIIAFGSIFGE